MRVDEVVLAEANEKVGLAYSAVADYQQLDQIIVTLLFFHY